MTSHVVCLDGTGQTRLQQYPTNIALIFNAMDGIIVDADNGSFKLTSRSTARSCKSVNISLASARKGYLSSS